MNTEKSILESREDSSVNFITEGDFPGYLEARYVRRDEKIIVYVSSQTGCKQACRMCHLTATGQTRFVDTTRDQFIRQAQSVLEWYDTKAPKALKVHFNFMARGEALENQYLLADSTSILRPFECMALARSLDPKYLVSTIMPKSMAGKKLIDIFPTIHPELYYSIYSINPAFRKHWLPKALSVEESLRMLSDWQLTTSKIPKLHWAFIQGHNDDPIEVEALCNMVNSFGIRVNVNIVRYNPYSERQGQESSDEVINTNVAIIQDLFPLAQVKIIPRVGFDVKASCGMFIPK